MTRHNTKYSVIGFDFDGVFLDSVREGHNAWKYRMLRKTLTHFDVPVNRQNMEKIYMDNLMKNIAEVCRDFGIGKAETLWRVREENLHAEKHSAIQNEEISLFRDTEAVESLSQTHTLAICSNMTQRLLDYAIDHFALNDYVSCWIGRDGDLEDLSRMKPNPHLLEKMMSLLNSTTVLYVGDRKQDRDAARQAGIDFLMLSRNGNEGDIQNLGEIAKHLQ